MKIFNKLIKNKVFQFGIINNKYIENFLKARKSNKISTMQDSELDNYNVSLSPDLEIDQKIKAHKKEQALTNNNTMRLNKKLLQGVKVLCHKENKKIEELCDKYLHKNFFIIHFGNGK